MMGPLLRRFSSLIGVFLVLAVIFGDFAQAHSRRRNPLSSIIDLSEARIRTPSNRVHSHSTFDLLFSLDGGNQDVKLSLEPNFDLISEGAKIEYTNGAGEVVRTEPLQQNQHKIYKGDAYLRDEDGWYQVGWARVVMTRDGANPLFEGAFTIYHNAHHIQTRNNYIRTRHPQDPKVTQDGEEFMVVWRDSDIQTNDEVVDGGELRKRGLEEGKMCKSDNLTFNNHPDHPLNARFISGVEPNLWGADVFGGSRLWRRGITKRQNNNYGSGVSVVSNPLLTIGSTDGCPKTRQVALIGVATDCTYTGDFSNEEEVKSNIINSINTASALYEKSFNISLALGQLSINPASCPSTPPESAKWNQPCSTETDIEARLSMFSEWRGKQSDETNTKLALWMLLTTCESGASVGLAWLGQVCKSGVSTNSEDKSFVTGTVVVARTKEEWKVMAHEIGHTFGANHDCTETECINGKFDLQQSQCCPYSTSQCDANGKYMMNPVTSETITNFSPCSIGAICSGIKNRLVDSSCLTMNSGVQTITEAVCGNGIVESGEECDCGGTEGCSNNSCCDATTCKFKNGAVCDDTNQDCCSNCQFAPSTKVCRTSNGECDPEETCTGTSGTCPSDEVKKDGTSCGEGGGKKCASGQCTSRDEQCRTSSIGTLRQFSNKTLSACNDKDCVLSCRSSDSPNVCVWISQNFVDGTPCQGDGFCRNGRCKGSTTGGQIKSWVEDHKPLVIGVATGVGFLLLLIIGSCIYSCLCGAAHRRRARKKALKNPIPASRNPQSQWQPIPSRDHTYPMPPPQNHFRSPQMNNSAPPTSGYQGSPPAYSNPNPNYSQAPRWG